MTSTKTFRSHCPINFALEHIGDKWTLLIIRDLMFVGKKSYGEFLKSDEKISTNILADRLAQLETSGIVSKRVDEDNSSRFVYALTSKGLDLMPVLLELVVWSARYDDDTEAPPQFVRRLAEERDVVLREMRERVGQNQIPTS